MDAGLQLDLTEAAMERDIEAQVQAAEFADATNGGSNGAVATAPATQGAMAPAAAAPVETAPAPVATAIATSEADVQTAAVQAMLADKMGDAPLCDTCGHITVRNGSCYRCLNCGESKGCS